MLNKSENERSGVLSTAMSFLGLYRDPTIAEVTSRSDWRIADLVEGKRPVSLYLVVPPSDISRTKPLVRLILNQIARRLTEQLDPAQAQGRGETPTRVSALAPAKALQNRRFKLLMMLDEFPALGRLEFFESALAFMAGYGIRAFLIAQSLNQIAKAYGENNAILDNCHVRTVFSTNDERTAKRISDALGTATEQRAMRNYTGHRLSPWLAHVMVSRQETARPLLTPGEIMQLPPSDEIVMISGMAPIRAKKLRYYLDPNFATRVQAPPALGQARYKDCPPPRGNDWNERVRHSDQRLSAESTQDESDTSASHSGGLQQERHPGLASEDAVKPVQPDLLDPLGLGEDETDLVPNAAVTTARIVSTLQRAHGLNEGSGPDHPLNGF